MRNAFAKTCLLLAVVIGISGSAQADVQVFPWTPRDILGAKLTLFPGYTDMLRQEQFGYSSTGQVATAAAANGNPVGSVFFPIGGQIATVGVGASDAWRPTLQGDSSGGRNNFLRFGTSSQGSMYDVQNSTGSFRFVHTIQRYTIAFFIRFQSGGSVGGDGVNNAVLDSNAQTGSNTGFCVYRDTDNKLYFGASKAGTNLVVVSSGTTTLTADGNWHYVVIQCAGPGSNACTMSIDGTRVGAATPVAGAPLGTDASFDLFIGQTAGASNRGQFDLDNLLITDTVISSTDLARWAAFNPPRTAASLLRVVRSAAELDPSDVSHAWAWWDVSTPVDAITQSPLVYTSNAKTTAVANSGDTAGYVENRLGAEFKRGLTVPSWGTSPAWTTGGQNGRSYALLSGSWNSGSSVSQPSGWTLNQTLPPGDKTWFFAAQQTQTGPVNNSDTGQVGAHLFCYSQGGGTAYAAIPGQYHAGAPLWFTEHITGDPGVAANQSLYPQVTVSNTTSPATAGTYVLSGGYGLGPQFFCAATNQYFWYSGTSWAISTTPGTLGSAFWQNSSSSLLRQNLSAGGSATGTASTGSTSPFPGPQGFNVFHGQQKGNKARLGVNGYWGSWVTTAGSMVFDSIGPDAHQLPTGNPTATQHFEFSGAIGEIAIFNYALPDHVTYGLLRRLQDKWNVAGMEIGN